VFPTVREIIALDPVRHGGPRVVTGETGLDRPVRWGTHRRGANALVAHDIQAVALVYPTAVLSHRPSGGARPTNPHVSPPGQSRKESTMRNLIRLAVAAAVTGVLVWLPTAAQAGITATGID
jgi:hypothetical protein